MADRSAIEWTDASWNPLRARLLNKVGDKAKGSIGWHCEHVTEGCSNCYAERLNHRLGTGLPFKPGHRKDIEIFLDLGMLTLPLRWKKSRKIFVCSMSDLFADFVTDEMLDKIFAVMALAPQHTFQVLTKRAARMREYCTSVGRADALARANAMLIAGFDSAACARLGVTSNGKRLLPLPNVWLGVSCERQQEADARIPLLLQTPAAVRFISAEPLLGAIDLNRITHVGEGWKAKGSALDGTRLDWVIAGGESGPKARPMHPDWPRALRDQCKAAGVAFHFKQWGEWAPHRVVPGDDLGGAVRAGRVRIVHPSGRSDVEVFEASGGHNTEKGSRYMARVGKATAGRLLDGVEHNEFPKVPG